MKSVTLAAPADWDWDLNEIFVIGSGFDFPRLILTANQSLVIAKGWCTNKKITKNVILILKNPHLNMNLSALFLNSNTRAF